MKYNVGDKVRVKSYEQMAKEYKVYSDGNIHFPGSACFFKKSGMERYCGKVFTVEYIANNHPEYRLAGTDGYSWIEEMLEPVVEEKIVITHDGREVVAKLYRNDKVEKIETAKCHPNDEFDFNTGAKLAFDRLMEDRVPVKWCYNNGIALGKGTLTLTDEGAYGTFKLRDLKVGDRVRVTMKRGDIDWCSAFDQCRTGEVIGIKDKAEGRRIGVRFDKKHPGLHSCSTMYESGDTIPKENGNRCWNVWEKDLELIWDSPSKAMAEYGKYAAKCFHEGVKAGEDQKPERIPVGTRVKFKASNSEIEFIDGKVGCVIYDDGSDTMPYVVEFDFKDHRLHNGGGMGKENQCRWCYAHNLEIIKDEPNRIPVGTRVRSKHPVGESVYDFLNGQIGKIIYDDGSSELPYLVEFENIKHRMLHNGNGHFKGADRQCLFCDRNDLEIVEDYFVEGDRVKIMEKYPHYDNVNGRMGTVVCMCTTRDRCKHYGIEIDDYHKGHNCGPQKLAWGRRAKPDSGRWFNRNDLELVTATDITPKKEEAVEEKTFKEGDRVKFIISAAGYPDTIGRTGTVICKSANNYGVEIDGDFRGHNCSNVYIKWGRCGTKGNCVWVNGKKLELVAEKVEKKTEFKVGDRVEVLDSYSFECVHGKRGTIVEVDEYGVVAVEMDEKYDSGHNCCGLTKDGFGRWFSSSESRDHLKKIEEVKEPEFKVGDRVEVLNTYYMKPIHGKKGTVVGFNGNGGLMVEMDEKFDGGHSCDGITRDGYGRYFGKSYWSDLKKLTGWNGKAVCVHATDGFTEGTVYEFKDGHVMDDDGDLRPFGGAVGVDDHWLKMRFTPYVEPALFNGKMVFIGKSVISFGSDFTPGKVYEFVDGQTTDDSGNKRPHHEPIKGDPTENGWIKNDFIPYVE